MNFVYRKYKYKHIEKPTCNLKIYTCNASLINNHLPKRPQNTTIFSHYSTIEILYHLQQLFIGFYFLKCGSVTLLMGLHPDPLPSHLVVTVD